MPPPPPLSPYLSPLPPLSAAAGGRALDVESFTDFLDVFESATPFPVILFLAEAAAEKLAAGPEMRLFIRRGREAVSE